MPQQIDTARFKLQDGECTGSGLRLLPVYVVYVRALDPPISARYAI